MIFVTRALCFVRVTVRLYVQISRNKPDRLLRERIHVTAVRVGTVVGFYYLGNNATQANVTVQYVDQQWCAMLLFFNAFIDPVHS
jgi:hypothetical protein